MPGDRAGHSATPSDYGSDLDADGEDIVTGLLDDLEANPIKELRIENIENDDERAVHHIKTPRSSQIGSGLQHASADPDLAVRQLRVLESRAVQELHDNTVARYVEAQHIDRTAERDLAAESLVVEDDTRSPLERFRTKPKKPLSVTDMVSPAWCELQYWYTLTKHGRKRRTPAMKQGSKVHRVLEEQVHTIVPVTITNKEDSWGLRIWNVVQGLRTLRSQGLTRELEVWGVIDGNVISGIIDEISFTCPDSALEEKLLEKKKSSSNASKPLSQTDINQFFQKGQQQTEHTAPPSIRRLYVNDVKTRTRPTLPTGAKVRPTRMQLMLYRKLLADLAANRVSADVLFSRHGLDAAVTFSESLLQQVLALDLESGDEDMSRSTGSQTAEMHELAQHNTLTLVWQLMIQEFQETIPSDDHIGRVLQAEYRNATDHSVIGRQTFAYDEQELDAYLEDELRWWSGQRKARGVEVEEAYKCQSCDFAEECTWRKEKLDEAVQRHRARQKSAHPSND